MPGWGRLVIPPHWFGPVTPLGDEQNNYFFFEQYKKSGLNKSMKIHFDNSNNRPNFTIISLKLMVRQVFYPSPRQTVFCRTLRISKEQNTLY